MAEAILPGSISVGNSNGPWEHIGRFQNTTSYLRIEGPIRAELYKYDIISISCGLTQALSRDSDPSLYFYGAVIARTRYTTIDPFTISGFTAFKTFHSILNDVGSAPSYLLAFHYGTNSCLDIHQLSNDVTLYLSTSGSTDLSYCLHGSAYTFFIDMYGIKDPFAE